MRRMKVMAIIIALLATPLALLARGMACEASPAMMCCAYHGSQHGKAMVCHCATKSKAHPPDFGLIAPFPPTKPASLARLVDPGLSRRAFGIYSQSAAQGFFSAPFEPPRA